MIGHRLSGSSAALLALLALTACSQDPSGSGGDAASPTPDNAEATPAASPESDATQSPIARSDAPPPGYTDGSGINEGYPDLTPSVLTPEAERSETGARNVLVHFARAIEMREYDQAWTMLGAQSQSQWSKARFNGLFEGLRDITVAVPNGTMEGAAGSSYYTSDAEITATDADGRPVRLEGPIVLRRANDVPGSTAEQRRWHIEQVGLAWTH